MSKAEAIVVTEPKAKVVPEFNEEEVVGIVNKGISAGKVNLPAGGTKLYEHEIHLVLGGSSFYLKAISNKKESVNSIALLVPFMSKRPIVVETLYGVFYGQVYSGYPGHYFSYNIQTIYNNDGTLELYESPDMVGYSVTDTVTEL